MTIVMLAVTGLMACARRDTGGTAGVADRNDAGPATAIDAETGVAPTEASASAPAAKDDPPKPERPLVPEAARPARRQADSSVAQESEPAGGAAAESEPGARRKDAGTFDRAGIAGPVTAGGNWPEFRGPSGDGRSASAGLPLRWSETENVAWKTAIHDAGWSSPVVWGDQVWTTTAKKDGKHLFAVCIDRNTGKVLHDIKVFDVARPQKVNALNSHASPTPAIEKGRIYVHYGAYGTACLDTATGKKLWECRDLECDHHMGPGSSVILFNRMLIFNVDGIDVQYVIALDKATGKTVWKTRRSVDYSRVHKYCRKAFSTPSVIRVNGQLQLVSPGAKAVIAYAPDTGDEIWKVRHNGWSMVARPVAGRGLVFVVTDYDRPELWALRPDGRGDVTGTHVAWKIRKDVPSTPSLLLVDGLLYMVSDKGRASCIDAKSGEVVWKERVGGRYFASPIYAEGRIYLFNRKAEATVIETGREFKTLATNALDGTTLQATPAVSGNALFLRTATHLYRIEDAAGRAGTGGATGGPSPQDDGPMGGPAMLKADALRKYVATFNRLDHTHFGQAVSNEAAADWMAGNVPLFECPDREIEEIYHFRWWTFRKHIKETPDGFVITEFLPKVGWSGKHNTISCPAGHHFREGRWIRDAKYLDDYAVFWFRKGGSPRRYSFWAADAMYARYLVRHDKRFVTGLLDDLVSNYRAWEKSRLEPDGLFWQIDDRDGMEVSIGGSGRRGQGKRATINSYMFGDALAIAAIAEIAGRPKIAGEYRQKAERIRRLVLGKLWDDGAKFFKVLPRGGNAGKVDVRELHGFTPWYFNLPEKGKGYEVAWKQLTDPKGFHAPFGPTTAEQRHPKFAVSYKGHECQWNGPSWPFATSVTLTALANVLNDYPQQAVSSKDYFETLKIYTKSHRLKREDGTVVPWIDENLNPHTGDWIARTRLKAWKNGTWDPRKGGVERGKDYNHSSYCDLIITGLVGLRPRADDTVEVNPLLPDGAWDWFCLDGVPYHGRILTILYDRTGRKYGKGSGLRVLADGKEIGASKTLGRLKAPLPPRKAAPVGKTAASPDAETAAGWVKHPGNPVLGGRDYGTIFDVSVVPMRGEYWMYVSWRPKKSIALSKSKDGAHWSEPRIVLGPADTGWEEQLNRPGVVHKDGVFHVWYTGQAARRSKIGYATSRDGVNFTRRAEPVLAAELEWETPSVMCPHVEWDERSNRFRMWYSGGEDYEPDAIGYATSADGVHWEKHPANPIFRADPGTEWEKNKVTACQILRHGDRHLMFYIGFENKRLARIGLARSRDGITGWERHPANPIISPTPGAWDGKSCYKPFAVFEKPNDRWLLWYNGRSRGEMIGLAVHDGEDLGFPE
ncbi:MAG: MGH1-like glycoside hydrolase domain-containing protein [Planctomycetota bacterium]